MVFYDVQFERLKHLQFAGIHQGPETIKRKVSEVVDTLRDALEHAEDEVTVLRERVEKLERMLEHLVVSEKKRVELRTKLLKEVALPLIGKGDPFEPTKDTWGVPFAELQKLLEE
jgi:hypothetical protein